MVREPASRHHTIDFIVKGNMTFRRARADERKALDEMTLTGVRHWGHDQNHPEVYQGLAMLLESEEGPDLHPVFVLEDDGKVVGFYDLRDRGDHVELVRMFLSPDLIGHGYGRTLWDHAVEQATAMSARMLIMADPGAVGFYQAMGAHLERHQEVAPGFSLGVFWYDLNSDPSSGS